MVRITPKKKDRREKAEKTAHPRRSKGRRRKYYGRSTARPVGNANIRGGAAERKTLISVTLRLPRLGKGARGSGGLKSRKCPEKKTEDQEEYCATLYLVPINGKVAQT